jgi:hypothetical protein
MTDTFHVSLLTWIALTASIWYVLTSFDNESDEDGQDETKLNETSDESILWDKNRIESLRSKHICSNITVSYSNTGGLMIMGVSKKSITKLVNPFQQ